MSPSSQRLEKPAPGGKRRLATGRVRFDRAGGRVAVSLGPQSADNAPEWWAAWVDAQLDRAWLYYWRAQADKIAEIVEKARPIVVKYGLPAQRSKYYWTLTLMAMRRDRYVVSDETTGYVREGLKAAEESGELAAVSDVNFELGFCHLWRNELDDADTRLRSAAELTERTGDIVLQTRCLTYLTVLHRKRGQVEEARRQALQTLAAATTANMPEYVAAAKAILAWADWREGNMAQVEESAHAALEVWRQSETAYPFTWMALFLLIDRALASNDVAKAAEHSERLLDSDQQRLPEALTEAATESVAAWKQHQHEIAKACLDRVIESAKQTGYL